MNRHTVVQKKLEKFMDKTAWIRFGFDHKCRAAASFPPRLWWFSVTRFDYNRA